MPNGRLAVTVIDHRGERHQLSLHANTVLAQVKRTLEKLLRVPAATIRASLNNVSYANHPPLLINILLAM